MIKMNKEEINQTTYELSIAINQVESMVKVMFKAECFIETTNNDFCDIQNILEVCKVRLEVIKDLYDTCEVNISNLCDLASESSSSIKLSQVLEVDHPSIHLTADLLGLVTQPSTDKAWHQSLVKIGNQLISASSKPPGKMNMINYLLNISRYHGDYVCLITDTNGSGQLVFQDKVTCATFVHA